MTTRAALKTTIRNLLDDTGASPLWSDTNLNEWINQAIRDYSVEPPREVAVTITAVGGQASYVLPSDAKRVLRLEQPKFVIRIPVADHRIAVYPPDLGQLVDYQSGVRTATTWTYRVFSGNLILDPAPATSGPGNVDLQLEYLATYPDLVADTDVLATPTISDHILSHLAMALAFDWLISDEEKRFIFESRTGHAPTSSADFYRELAASEITALKPAQTVKATTLEVL